MSKTEYSVFHRAIKAIERLVEAHLGRGTVRADSLVNIHNFKVKFPSLNNIEDLIDFLISYRYDVIMHTYFNSDFTTEEADKIVKICNATLKYLYHLEYKNITKMSTDKNSNGESCSAPMAENHTLSAENENLRDKIAGLGAVNSLIEMEKNDLIKEKGELIKEKDELIKEKDELIKEKDDLRQKNDELRKENIKFEQLIYQKGTKINAQVKKIKSLTDKLETIKSHIADLTDFGGIETDINNNN